MSARAGLLAIPAILLAPLAVRLPAWLLGLSADPIWASSGLSLPGARQALPGLPGFLDFNAGWTTQALGGLAAREWLAGRIPWWDPFSGIGMPLAAEVQSSALFLPYVLLLALPGGMLLLAVALQWTAGLATWRLLLRMELGQGAAVVGAVAFELSGGFAWLGPPMNLPIAFLPMFLLGIERARAATLGSGRGGWRLTALAVALSLYAGFPETAYLDGLLALLWAALRWTALPGRRSAFALRVGGGGAAGLLLAAPLLWPFLELLPDSSLGPRELVHMSDIAVQPQGWILLLMPAGLGMPAGLSGLEPSGELVALWGRVGGFAGMALALAAPLGAFVGGPNRILRGMLLAWVALLLARIMGASWAMTLFGALPFHDQLQVFRYSPAAWLLPCCILAAHALARPARPWLVRLAAAATLAAGCATAWLAWPLLRSVPDMRPYFAASVVWAAVSLAAATWAFARGRRRWMAAVLVADMAALFVSPLGAAYRGAALDMPAITFLKANLGLQRFATLGPFLPNYGALFGAASVNYDYLPAPRAWTDHVLAHLRPGAMPVLFPGNYPPDVPGQPSNADILAAHLRDYADLGVRYVVAPAGQDPFVEQPPRPPGPWQALRLGPGDSVSGGLPAAARRVSGLDVQIGTYLGAATGVLRLEVCAGAECAHGEAPLATAADNAALEIALDAPVAAGAPLTWTLSHSEGAPVAVWTAPGAHGPEPIVAPTFAASGGLARVYEDELMTIYEAPDAAPYFSVVGGPCVLTPLGRTEVDALCDAPATLVRRELMLPGWRVAVGGDDMQVPREEDLFQAAPLPAGPSRAAFRYRPPHAPVFTALFVLGWLCLLPWDRAFVRGRSVSRSGPADAPWRPRDPST